MTIGNAQPSLQDLVQRYQIRLIQNCLLKAQPHFLCDRDANPAIAIYLHCSAAKRRSD